MNLRRKLLALAMVVTAVVPGMVVATAAPALAAQDGYCRPENQPSHTCIQFNGDKNGFTATAFGAGYYGHVDIWGPGITFENSLTGNNPLISRRGLGSGWVCAHGWAHQGGAYIDMGFPCVPVPQH